MKDFIRPGINDLEAYRVENPAYEVILNANENPYDFPVELKKELCEQIMAMPLNRYPEACYPELLTQLSDYTGVPDEQIICGSGSDELIAMLNQAFVNPGEAVVCHRPSFAMYSIWTTIAGGELVAVPDSEDDVPNVDKIIAAARTSDAKLIYICNPNNPTGYLFPRHDIVQIIEETDALVILDEAYMEFKGATHVDLIDIYPNVVVLRTLSKAFGLAAIRCGYALGPKPLIDAMYKVKSPYNLNSLTQAAAVIALKNRDKLLDRLNVLNVERRRMYKALRELPLDKLYPTAANFIYFETSKACDLYAEMKENGILIKYFPGNEGEGSIRLSIGSPQENEKVLKILKKVLK